MFRGNPLHTGLSVYKGSQVNTLKWKYKTNDDGYHIYSSPVIAPDGTIYIGCDDKYLYAVTPNGSKKWRFKTGGKVVSTAAISADGTIYVGTDDEKLYAINPDGTEKWKYKTNNKVQSSPVIGPDGTIYVGSNSGDLYAINPDGTLKWKYDTGDGSIFSSPALSPDGTIYIGTTNGYLTAISSNGSKLWKYDASGGFHSSPAIGPDGTIYIGSTDGYLFAIAADGNKLWKYDAESSITSSPAIGPDGTIYVGSSHDNFLAINPDGTKKWAFKKDANFDSSPIIGADGIIYVGCNDGKLYAIKPDGTELWRYNTNGKIFSSPAIGADGTIYVGSKTNLYAIGPPSQPETKTLFLSAGTGSPGSTVEVFVNIDDAQGIKSGEITITFDSTLLSAQDAKTTDISFPLTLTSNISNGEITLTFSSSTALSGGNGKLFIIPFTVNTSAPPGSTPLRFKSAQLKNENGNNFELKTIDSLFTVVVEEIIIISLPEITGYAGETVNAIIEINNASGILAGDFVINYDSTKVRAGEASLTELTSDFTIISVVEEDKIKISIASASPIISGSGGLISIPFTINPEASGTSPLRFSRATIYNQEYQEIKITTKDGSLTIYPACTKGDLNNDGMITSVDALIVLQICVGLIEPDEYQLCAGDVNNDGKINSLDAALILQYSSISFTSLLAEKGQQEKNNHNNMVILKLPDLTGETGTSFVMPVNLDNASGILATDFTIKFDPEMLEATSVDTTSLTSDFSLVCNINRGEIRVSLASSTPIISDSGSLVEVHFKVLKSKKRYSLLQISDATISNQGYEELAVNTENGSFIRKR